MKIVEYPRITNFVDGNILLTDGPSGTKTISVQDAVLSGLGLISPENHKLVFRGKNLGNSVSTAQKTAIQNGTFDDIWLGDYWSINNITWRIVDIDYWYNVGDDKFSYHHLVVMPDELLYQSSMNTTSTTAGGYTGSAMYKTGLTNAKSTINSAFGSNVLQHREYLITTVTSGYPSAGSWQNSTIDLPNEPMIYGSYIYTPSSGGNTDVKRYTASKTQLALFRLCPRFIVSGSGYWLRDIASATHFARVDGQGGATSTGGANSFGVRPVFAIG